MADVGSIFASVALFLYADPSGTVPIDTGFLVGYPVPDHPEQTIPSLPISMW